MNSKSRSLTKIFVLAAVVSAPFLLSSNLALAAGDDGDGLVIEELVVTATKRAESLQDVAMSVNVVTGEKIDNLGIVGFEDLQSYVPNLTVHETIGSYIIRMRGVGASQNNLGFTNSVGLFVDGVYSGRSRSFQIPFVDVERVEVVKGPQGALFGKNTLAGAVSTVSRQPGDEFEAELTVGTEFEEGGTTVVGAISGPLSDKVGARLAFNYEDIDGYMHNIATGLDDGGVNKLALRGILTFDPTDNLSIVAKAEGGYRDFDGYVSQARGSTATATEDFDQERNVLGLFDEELDDTNFFNATVRADLDLGAFTLTSITGYQEFDSVRQFWADGTTLAFVDQRTAEDYEQFSQELRITSATGGAIDYMAGIFYSKDDDAIALHAPFDYGAIGLPFLGRVWAGGNYTGEIETLSAYGQLTWNISENLRLVGGVRWSEDKADATSYSDPTNWDPVTVSPNPGVDPLQDAIAGGRPPSPFAGPPFNFGNWKYDIAEQRKDDFLDPSITIEFDVNDDIMLYGSFAQGSKAGGFVYNITSRALVGMDAAWQNQYMGRVVTREDLASSQITLQPGNAEFDFEPEEADAFEVGAKMKVFDGRGILNVALFHSKFRDLQVAIWNGERTIVSNAGAAISKGVEIEFDMRMTEALTISASYGYLDATWDEYENTVCLQIDDMGTPADPNCVAGFGSLTGRQLERSPENQATLSADWESRLTEKVLLRFGAVASYSDSFHVHTNESPAMTQKSYTKFDAYAGIASSDDRWELTLLGRNLGDKITMHDGYGVDILGSNFRIGSTAPPRLVSLQGTVRF